MFEHCEMAVFQGEFVPILEKIMSIDDSRFLNVPFDLAQGYRDHIKAEQILSFLCRDSEFSCA